MSGKVTQPATGRRRRTHNQSIARDLASRVRKSMGPAMTSGLLSPRMVEMLAAYELVSILAVRTDYSDDCAALFETYLQLRHDLGLREE